MPSTSTDKIANEAILFQAVQNTNKLSVMLRAQGDKHPSLARLRRYVGEVYSSLWDVAMASGTPDFCDVVVYPQNLPNAAPEQWIHHAADLDSVCSHDSICGWVSSSALGRGLQFQSNEGDGFGGLEAHVQALNADRTQRKLSPLQAISVDPWPLGASAAAQKDSFVDWLDDEHFEEENADIQNDDNLFVDDSMDDECDTTEEFDPESACDQLGGARIPRNTLYEKVAVGGTFDGMHYGHRKLLTLAVSSVNPRSGQLTVGVTVDAMLQHKKFAEEIPQLEARMAQAKEFVYRLAPGMKNRVRVVAISEEYGPPGTEGEGEDFDALVLSHETLENGCLLNQHRINTLGYKPLKLLCTRRTEPHGMSSTALRRIRWQQQQEAAKTKI
ncbi:unnamed protein product [Cylindrotheca closterium]|uniref:Cytidyltransferase-like domain-containing protein n=1 Tax=Cylindrotheca closterium TaxID=2856 RepID=A0AAD2G4B6_9STRA|nr:unnamed protein product [Cylindrotheca closterium]